MITKYLLTAILGVTMFVTVNAESISPWGVCAHFNRKAAEFDYRTDEQLRLLKDAGVKSVRMDMNFSGTTLGGGKYDFSHYDVILNKLNENGMSLMPILSGYSWEVEKKIPELTPLHEHPEAWRGFVRAAATHFKGKITVWSFWNEPYGGFWTPKPDPKQYMVLLKITHEELKKVDPTNKVMLGGINVNFLRDVYKLGGKPYFDIVSTHPYGWGGDRNAGFNSHVDQVKELFKKYNDEGKELWFTECGSSSARNEFIDAQPQAVMNAIKLAYEKTGKKWGDVQKLKVGVPVLLQEERDSFSNSRQWLPGVEFVPVTIKDLSPEKFPIIIGCESESVNEEFVKPFINYVKRGGIIIAFGQVPFYSLSYTNELDTRAAKGDSERLHSLFRMGFHTWWLRSGTPEETNYVVPGPGMTELGFKPSVGHVNRYLNGDSVRAKDTYTPILQVKVGDKVVGDAMVLYTFGDWKGAIIGSTLIKFGSLVTEQEQADLAQTFCVYSIAKGISRSYLYVFRNTGNSIGEIEDNFGMVRRNLQPKPYYNAYKAMTTALGEKPEYIKSLTTPEEFFMMIFKRHEDNKKVLAFWSINPQREYSVSGIDGVYKDGSVHFVVGIDDSEKFEIITK